MTARARRLGWRALLAYAAPALPLAMLGLPLNVSLPAFWAGPMGVRIGTVGLVMTLVRLLDVLFDPAIGRASDRMPGWLRRRFGRRKPFVVAGAPLGVLGGALLFFPPPGAGAGHLALAYALLTLGWGMISLPWQAWGAELSDDYAERTRIVAWREAGTLVGVLLAAVLPFALGLNGPEASLHVLAAVALGLAIPSFAGLLGGVREPAGQGAAFVGGLRPALRSAWANRPFRRLLLAWTLNGIANGLPAALFALICTHILRAPEAFSVILLVYFLAGIVGVPLWTMLARSVGKHRTWCWAMLATCAAFLPVITLGPGDVGMFLGICVVTGVALGADLALPPSMQADVVELDVLNTGEHRAGLFFAAWTMAQKAGNALAVGLGFGLLDLAGFEAQASNPPAQLLALRLLYCLVPVLLKLAAVAVMWGYPIDAAEQARIRGAIMAVAR